MDKNGEAEMLLAVLRELAPTIPPGTEGFVPHDPNQPSYVMIGPDDRERPVRWLRPEKKK